METIDDALNVFILNIHYLSNKKKTNNHQQMMANQIINALFTYENKDIILNGLLYKEMVNAVVAIENKLLLEQELVHTLTTPTATNSTISTSSSYTKNNRLSLHIQQYHLDRPWKDEEEVKEEETKYSSKIWGYEELNCKLLN